MKQRKILGISMYAAPFVVALLLIVRSIGWSPVLIGLGSVILLVLWFGIAVTLATKKG